MKKFRERRINRLERLIAGLQNKIDKLKGYSELTCKETMEGLYGDTRQDIPYNERMSVKYIYNALCYQADLDDGYEDTEHTEGIYGMYPEYIDEE